MYRLASLNVSFTQTKCIVITTQRNYSLMSGMKVLSDAEQKEVLIQILSVFDSYCKKHNLRYFIGYGALLGAVRHKGFIPWDDDVDIVIPRPDFERFCKEFRSSEGYTLYAPEDGKSYLTFARVCDNLRTNVITKSPWCNEPTGIWIDIFPLDGMPDNDEDFSKIVKSVRILMQKEMRARWTNLMDVSHLSGFKEHLL